MQPKTEPVHANVDNGLVNLAQKTKKFTRKQFWHWSIVVIAAAATAALVLVQAIKPEETEFAPPVAQKPAVYDTLPAGYSFKAAPQGKLPAGFPKELVLVKDYEVIRGEDTIDGTGANQKKVDLAVSQPSADIFSLYESQMFKLGWENNLFNDHEVKALGFKKADQRFYVTIVAKTPTTSQVSLTLVIPK